MDVDKFKTYNTHLGYELADKKLKELADLLRNLEKSVEKYRIIKDIHPTHLSGDEFVIVFETNTKNDGDEVLVAEAVQDMLSSVQN